MHTLFEIIEAITDILQFDYKEANDENIGLVIGPEDKSIQSQIPIKKVGISLNLTAYSIAKAVNKKVDLLISYDPLFYSCINKIDYTLLRKIRLLAQERTYVFVLGYPILYADNGINDTLLGLLEIKDTRSIECNTCSISHKVKRFKIGYLQRKIMIRELAREIGKKVGSINVRIFGSPTDFANTITFIGGNIENVKTIAYLKSSKVDVIVTGDLNYKIQTYLQDAQLDAIEIGYTNSIKPGLKVFKSLLQLKIPKVEVTLLDTDDFLVSEINIL